MTNGFDMDAIASHEEDLDIDTLNDSQLYEKLKENNIVAGPIVDSTRKIYKKKLKKVLYGYDEESFVSGGEPELVSDKEDEYETVADEEEETIENGDSTGPIMEKEDKEEVVDEVTESQYESKSDTDDGQPSGVSRPVDAAPSGLRKRVNGKNAESNEATKEYGADPQPDAKSFRLLSSKKSDMPGKRSKDEGEAKEQPPPKMNKTATDWSSINFDSAKKTGEGYKWNLKISSWNMDGLRACVKKGGAHFLEHEKPEVLCLQETKVSEKDLPEEMKDLDDYPYCYWLAAKKEGYSSVGLLSKTKPINVEFGFGEGGGEHDDEGRLITAEYDTFFLVTAYVPNAGKKLVTLDKRMDWDPKFRNHVKKLDEKKPVIICGDLNVAHEEIDLKNPKTNKKNAGFTPEEREGFRKLLEAGFVDTYRHYNPEKTDAYTFWTYMMGCRAKNVGWRLDYFLTSSRLVPRLADSVIRDQVFGSDHCPITLLLQKPE